MRGGGVVMNQAINDVSVQRGATMVRIIYVLYLTGVATCGITALVGLVMAYVYQDEAPDWLKSHYRLLTRTFWIGLLFMCVSVALMFVLVGFLLMLVSVLWWIIRCIKGMKYVDEQKPYPQPDGWMV
jgi:uncharacterized membrane protein